MATNPDVIAQVQQLEQLKSLFSDYILLYINLNSLSRSLQMGKPSLSHQAIRHYPACQANLHPVRFESLGTCSAMFLNQFGWRVRPPKFPRKPFIAKRLYLLQFLLSLFNLVPRFELQVSRFPFRGLYWGSIRGVLSEGKETPGESSR